jgi:hypothetical protein
VGGKKDFKFFQTHFIICKLTIIQFKFEIWTVLFTTLNLLAHNKTKENYAVA